MYCSLSRNEIQVEERKNSFKCSLIAIHYANNSAAACCSTQKEPT